MAESFEEAASRAAGAMQELGDLLEETIALPERTTRVIHTRYYSGNVGILPVLVVAAENAGGRGTRQDWAAYIGGLHHYGEATAADVEHVRAWGCKLTEEQARGHFPNLYGTPYRR